MTALALAGPLTEAETLFTAADLIDRWGLCVTAYEGPDESLDPSGAVAVAVGYPADVWSAPTEAFIETGAYDLGVRTLYVLVASIGRWDMSRPADDPWDGESLANHIAWWLEDVTPSVEQVLHQMRAAAEQIGASA